MFVSPSVDQLRVHTHFAARTLDASFQDVSNAKLLRDLAQIPWIAGFVDHHRRVTNHFQIGYLGEISQNLVLDTISEERIFFVGRSDFQTATPRCSFRKLLATNRPSVREDRCARKQNSMP